MGKLQKRTDGAIKRKSRPFEKLSGEEDLLWMGLWKELGCYAKAAVEVMLSGKNTEDIQAEIGIIYFIMLYILF